jgi:hypothetical protein
MFEAEVEYQLLEVYGEDTRVVRVQRSNVRNFEAEESVRRIVIGVADPQQEELLTTEHSRKTRSAATHG